MSVADILEQLARNAGRARPSMGSVISGAVADAARVPGQILADRERVRVQQLQEARQAEQIGFARNADTRAGADQAMQDTANKAAMAKEKALRDGIAAGFAADPKTFDLPASIDAVTKAGFPDLEKTLTEVHLRNVKPTAAPLILKQGDTAFDPLTRKPIEGMAVERTMTPAEQAQRDETARHNKETERISALTAGRTEAAQQETARHNRATEKSADPFGGAAAGGLTGEQLLAKMPADQRAQSQALVDGRRSLDARLASSPYGRTIIAGAYAIDPTFDQGNYNARNKARSDLTSPNGTGGKTIGALNTAIQHAGKLSDLIEKLDNYELPAANAVVNPVRTAFGSTKVTNYDTVAPQLAKEIERVWRGAGGTAGEIKDLIETIGHNKGKQQQREALAAFVDLAKGKLDTQEQQRDHVMGAAGASIPILFEKNKSIVDTIMQRASGKPATAAPAGMMRVVGPNGETGSMPSGNALPPGWRKE